MRRYQRDGKIAVLYHADGWYTQHGYEELIFDPDLVQAVLDGCCKHGLSLAWVMPGDKFRPELWQGQEIITVFVVGSCSASGSQWSCQWESWLTA